MAENERQVAQRERDRDRDRKTERLRETERQRDTDTERHRETERYRETERQRERKETHAEGIANHTHSSLPLKPSQAAKSVRILDLTVGRLAEQCRLPSSDLVRSN